MIATSRSGGMPDDLTGRWTARLGLAVFFGYLVFYLCWRVVVWDGLIFDNTYELVDHAYLALDYGLSNPPLMHWVYALVLPLAGWEWGAADLAIRFGLSTITGVLIWDAVRREAGGEAAAAALLGLVLMPVLSWFLLRGSTHSLGIAIAVAGMIHAVSLMRNTGHSSPWIYLGVACAIGALSKYNMTIFVGCFFLAGRLTGFIPRDIAKALGLAVLLIAVPYAVQLLNFEETTARMARLSVEDRDYAGDWEAMRGGAALKRMVREWLSHDRWMFAALLIAAISAVLSRQRPGTMAGFALLASAAFVLLNMGLAVMLDAETFHYRYLIPGLMLLPVLLGGLVQRRATLVLLAALTLVATVVQFRHGDLLVRDRMTIRTLDYAPLAAALEDVAGGHPVFRGHYLVAGPMRVLMTPRIAAERKVVPSSEVTVWIEPNEAVPSLRERQLERQGFFEGIPRGSDAATCVDLRDRFAPLRGTRACYVIGPVRPRDPSHLRRSL